MTTALHSFRFTVFTPAYNRAHTLHRVYFSLCQQQFRDFEWLVVDDGSTDNTISVVKNWRESSPFPIRYFYQAHGHKKSATNLAVREACGEFFFTVDSDDELTPNALAVLDRQWRDIPADMRSRFSGVTGLCIDDTGNIVGETFPQDVLDSDSMEIRYRFRVYGEKSGFQRTDVMREFPYPADVDGYVPEGIVWSAIAKRYKTRFVNEVIRIYHSGPDTLSRSTDFDSIAVGTTLWAREVLSNEIGYFLYDPIWFLKMAANYTRFGRHAKRRATGRHWPICEGFAKALVILMWPVGTLQYYRDNFRHSSKLR